jgi:hypothetical protein
MNARAFHLSSPRADFAAPIMTARRRAPDIVLAAVRLKIAGGVFGELVIFPCHASYRTLSEAIRQAVPAWERKGIK